MWQYQQREMSYKKKQKRIQYMHLCTEIQQMWNMKCMIIPVVLGATGIVTKGLKKNLEAIPGKHSIDHNKRQICLQHHM
jgi:hypothetical protein